MAASFRSGAIQDKLNCGRKASEQAQGVQGGVGAGCSRRWGRDQPLPRSGGSPGPGQQTAVHGGVPSSLSPGPEHCHRPVLLRLSTGWTWGSWHRTLHLGSTSACEGGSRREQEAQAGPHVQPSPPPPCPLHNPLSLHSLCTVAPSSHFLPAQHLPAPSEGGRGGQGLPGRRGGGASPASSSLLTAGLLWGSRREGCLHPTASGNPASLSAPDTKA